MKPPQTKIIGSLNVTYLFTNSQHPYCVVKLYLIEDLYYGFVNNRISFSISKSSTLVLSVMTIQGFVIVDQKNIPSQECVNRCKNNFQNSRKEVL